MSTPATLRCAIYTRKSSDEGLEQSFNSLHAQREACEAYIKSQAGEGWWLRSERYDDGGYSGANMERPALRRLLADIAAQKVDAVVVYKVDRLTRSLLHFASIIEVLDKAQVSFVSVTQAFNTTTSMGRLTLNVLLSFAQYEREITGERIRDKIAASKAKGMWMGGMPPLGYDPPIDQASRALAVNEAEAKTVRLIFQRYLELGNLLTLQRWLQDQGVRSKQWTSTRYRQMGGYNFSRGALRHLLQNRTYLGVVVHKGADHPGRHPAIVDAATFAAVQDVLASKGEARRKRVPRAAAFLLHHRVFDGDGQAMAAVVAYGLHKRIYRYYASPPAWPRQATDDDAIRRVPANVVEDLVRERIGQIVSAKDGDLDRAFVRAAVARVEVHATATCLVVRPREVAATLGQRLTIENVRQRLQPGEHVGAEPGDSRLMRIVLPVRLKPRGGRTWAAGPGNSPLQVRPHSADRRQIERLRAAHAVLRACGATPEGSSEQLRAARSLRYSRQMALVRWAFLAPDIQERILVGRGVPGLELASKPGQKIPLLWSEQRALFGCFDRRPDENRPVVGPESGDSKSPRETKSTALARSD